VSSGDRMGFIRLYILEPPLGVKIRVEAFVDVVLDECDRNLFLPVRSAMYRQRCT
jgi:hypothetical protein